MKIFIAIALFALTGCLARPTVEIMDMETHEKQNEIISRELNSSS